MLGDVLLQVGEVKTASVEALHAALGPESVGKQLNLRYLRGGSVGEAPATVGERPASNRRK